MEIKESPYATQAEVAELDRQVERGSLFTQATLERGFRRLGQAESLLVELVQALAAKGVVSEQELGIALKWDGNGQANGQGNGQGNGHEAEDRADNGDDEIPAEPPSRIGWPTIALRADDPDQGPEPEVLVDCDARMHICHAVCCKLKFPLAADEVDAGTVKWDIGHPYIIRQESSGYCTHNDTSTGRCGIYEDRPAICRRYSCANDGRIWKDFENMVLNQEWIDDHLGKRDLHVTAVLPSMEDAEAAGPTE